MPELLSDALFSKSQSAVLGLLYAHADEPFYLRKIIRLTRLGVGHVQRELARLSEAGILRRFERDRHVYFQANPECPIFTELRGIVLKTVGAAGLLRQALAPLGSRIRIAFIYGSVARGRENAASDMDLMVIGEATFAEIAEAAHGASGLLHRAVNPTVYPCAEFRDKLSRGHHFLGTVLKGLKLFVIGDEHELRHLLEERLDQAAPGVARRNPAAAGDRRPRHRASPSA